MIQLLGFLNICPIHVHLLFFSKISGDSCFVACHKFSFLILSLRIIFSESRMPLSPQWESYNVVETLKLEIFTPLSGNTFIGYVPTTRQHLAACHI